MSTKSNSYPFIVYQHTAVTTTVTSAITNALQRDDIGYELSWANGSGTPTGTFFVQVQNLNSDTWSDLNFGTAITLSGNSGTHTVSIIHIPFASVRVQYVPSAGQVDLLMTVVTKKIGG
jgi:hypothetical protein